MELITNYAAGIIGGVLLLLLGAIGGLVLYAFQITNSKIDGMDSRLASYMVEQREKDIVRDAQILTMTQDIGKITGYIEGSQKD